MASYQSDHIEFEAGWNKINRDAIERLQQLLNDNFSVVPSHTTHNSDEEGKGDGKCGGG